MILEQTTTEQPDNTDPYRYLSRLLSELPTDKAMKDMAKGKIVSESARKVVQTMALEKDNIMRLIREIKRTERIAVLMLQLHKGVEALGKDLEKDGFSWDLPVKIEYPNGN